MALALVWRILGAYLRFAKKVNCPGPACSIPATPTISSSPSPSSRQPRLPAISRSFITRFSVAHPVHTIRLQSSAESSRRARPAFNPSPDHCCARAETIRTLSRPAEAPRPLTPLADYRVSHTAGLHHSGATLPIMSYQQILFETDEQGVALVTINRPDKRNALSIELVAELEAAFDRVENDRSVRALILTGAGDKAF